MFIKHLIVHLYFFNFILLNLLTLVNLYKNQVHILFVHHLQTFFILIFMPYILIFLSLLFFLINLYDDRFFIQLILELHMYLLIRYLHLIFMFNNIFNLILIELFMNHFHSFDIHMSIYEMLVSQIIIVCWMKNLRFYAVFAWIILNLEYCLWLFCYFEKIWKVIFWRISAFYNYSNHYLNLMN